LEQSLKQALEASSRHLKLRERVKTAPPVEPPRPRASAESTARRASKLRARSGLEVQAHRARTFYAASTLRMDRRTQPLADPPRVPLTQPPTNIASLSLSPTAFNALLGDLRNVHQAIAAGENGDERTEIHEARRPCLRILRPTSTSAVINSMRRCALAARGALH